MEAEPNHAWVVAIEGARRRLTRLKAAVAIGGTLTLGIVAALAAAASPAPVAQAPSVAASPSTDAFGQGIQPGPDNQPPSAVDPGNPGNGGGFSQGAPPIVTAQS